MAITITPPGILTTLVTPAKCDCQSGVWRKPGGGVSGHKNCTWLVGAAYQTRICPSPMVLVGFNYVGYGSGYSDHHAYCCELE